MESMEHVLMNHSLTVTKNQKMICQFCNSVCLKRTKERKRFWWWQCKDCDVLFLVSLKGNIETIEFESKEENDRFYTIHLLIKKKRTDILVWNKNSPLPTYTIDLVTSFNQILEINPTNFNNKLKTYLLLL